MKDTDNSSKRLNQSRAISRISAIACKCLSQFSRSQSWFKKSFPSEKKPQPMPLSKKSMKSNYKLQSALKSRTAKSPRREKRPNQPPQHPQRSKDLPKDPQAQKNSPKSSSQSKRRTLKTLSTSAIINMYSRDATTIWKKWKSDHTQDHHTSEPLKC